MEKIYFYIIMDHLFLHYFTTTQLDIACAPINGLKMGDNTLTMHHVTAKYRYT
jgi:hypothetical protein